jgi:hypothetical protein
VRIGIRAAKNVGRGALVCFWVFAVIPALASVDTTHPLAFLDSPESDAAVRGVQLIQGWALDPESGIKSVRIWVDGASMNFVSFPMIRKDGNPGFMLLWNTRFWPNGRHTIKVRIVNGGNLPSELERTVSVANGVTVPAEPRPPLPFAGTWSSLVTAALRPDDPLLGITVDPRNRLTLWAISRGRQSVFSSAQGVLNSDGSFNLLSTEGTVRVTGRIADDRQSVQVTVAPPGLVPFSATGRGWPGSNSLSRHWAGTFTGAAMVGNGQQIRVELSIDSSGNATCQAQLGRLRQSSISSVTPDGRLLVPGWGGNIQIGWLGEVYGRLMLRYRFWHPDYPDLFEVPLQPFQPSSTLPAPPPSPPTAVLNSE